MRRTDRLFDLIQILRDGRLAPRLGTWPGALDVSIRTIWRDMATLIAVGPAGRGRARRGLHPARAGHPAAR